MADIPITHPGEHLAEILEDIGLSPTEFAKATGKEKSRINAIVKSQEPITAGIAVVIGKALDMTPEFWLSLQSDYHKEMASEAEAGVKPIPMIAFYNDWSLI